MDEDSKKERKGKIIETFDRLVYGCMGTVDLFYP